MKLNRIARTVLFLSITLCLGVIFYCILQVISRVQSTPYMDEIFHVPQMQRYCNYSFYEWDPMITTLPGLYFTSLVVLVPVSWMSRIVLYSLCSPSWLRLINVLFSLCNFVVFAIIVKGNMLNTNKASIATLLTALNLTLLPVLHFFTYLYYTDQGSTFFVFLMYSLSLHMHHKCAAIAGAVAIFFRQTNVIWVIFMIVLSAKSCVFNYVSAEKKDSSVSIRSFQYLSIVIRRLFNAHLSSTVRLVGAILADTWPYITVGAAFALFVYVNGSIVVGAKQDHAAVFHVPQLFYFASFTFAHCSLQVFSLGTLKRFLTAVCNHPIRFCFIVALCLTCVYQFTYVHRYLLADNRHYTFYVWSKLYARHYSVKYLLVPVYIFAIHCLTDAMSHQDILWKLGFAVCVALNIVPSPLLEFRYFIVPFIMYRMNLQNVTVASLLVETIVYCCINAVTVYLFIMRPFTWPNSPDDVQRFMW